MANASVACTSSQKKAISVYITSQYCRRTSGDAAGGSGRRDEEGLRATEEERHQRQHPPPDCRHDWWGRRAVSFYAWRVVQEVSVP